mmetsp:Transcript_27717/g.69707  ORF Transcript_27717/g.69707 Transcript_27717/m.69707 type:complete len:322 (+) Transcript_27717:266-1231(+)
MQFEAPGQTVSSPRCFQLGKMFLKRQCLQSSLSVKISFTTSSFSSSLTLHVEYETLVTLGNAKACRRAAFWKDASDLRRSSPSFSSLSSWRFTSPDPEHEGSSNIALTENRFLSVDGSSDRKSALINLQISSAPVCCTVFLKILKRLRSFSTAINRFFFRFTASPFDNMSAARCEVLLPGAAHASRTVHRGWGSSATAGTQLLISWRMSFLDLTRAWFWMVSDGLKARTTSGTKRLSSQKILGRFFFSSRAFGSESFSSYPDSLRSATISSTVALMVLTLAYLRDAPSIASFSATSRALSADSKTSTSALSRSAFDSTRAL